VLVIGVEQCYSIINVFLFSLRMKTPFCAMLMILIAVFMLLNYFLLQLPAI